MVDQLKCEILNYTEHLAKQIQETQEKMPVKLFWQCLRASLYSRIQNQGCSEGIMHSADLHSLEQRTH